jgi:hypothetical protein
MAAMDVVCPHCHYDFADNDPEVTDPIVKKGIAFSKASEYVLVGGQVIAGLGAIVAFFAAIGAAVRGAWPACFEAVLYAVLTLALLVTFVRVQKI